MLLGFGNKSLKRLTITSQKFLLKTFSRKYNEHSLELPTPVLSEVEVKGGELQCV